MLFYAFDLSTQNIRLWFVLLYITVLRAILIRVTDGSTFDCGLFFYTLRSWERYLSVLLMVQHSIVVCSSIHYSLESATYPCYWWFNIRLWFVLLYITVLRAILIRVTDGSTFDCGLFFYTLRSWERILIRVTNGSTFDCGLFFYTLRSWERNLSVLLMVQHSIVVCCSRYIPPWERISAPRCLWFNIRLWLVILYITKSATYPCYWWFNIMVCSSIHHKNPYTRLSLIIIVL